MEKDELIERLKHNRPGLTVSSLYTYSSTLSALYKKVFGNNDIDLAKFNDTEKILDALKDKEFNARKSSDANIAQGQGQQLKSEPAGILKERPRKACCPLAIALPYLVLACIDAPYIGAPVIRSYCLLPIKLKIKPSAYCPFTANLLLSLVGWLYTPLRSGNRIIDIYCP
jgi:hypothetical protein